MYLLDAELSDTSMGILTICSRLLYEPIFTLFRPGHLCDGPSRNILNLPLGTSSGPA